MIPTSLSSTDLDPRRRRALFRARHRGIREMDVLLGRFCDAHLASLSDEEVGELEGLLEAPDQDVFSWLTGAALAPERYDLPVFRKLAEFHRHAGPLDL
ncbi:MAG TPA: succinate dehydrogenase assembly factor 2 [Beijerinckiaceae bacterium]|nr:succinate dehydrogenase assembly factor 2 [Beijerinckiaceae bacterium]HVB89106.1 succinate dehydrogenase assembly factor 2 [Beijerinckiaceae bacterium]